MHRLIYTSVADIERDGASLHEETRKIVAISAKKNKKRELTGVLLLVNGTFIQVLEGKRENIEDAFETICCDLRHKQIKVIELEPAKGRLFANWDMAFVGSTNEPTQLHVNRDLQHIAVTIDARPAQALRQILQLVHVPRN